MVFGEVVGFVECASAPIDDELALADAVTDPVEAHVDGFGSALFYGVIGDTGGCVVVSDNGSGRLRVAEFFEARADGTCFLAVVK